METETINAIKQDQSVPEGYKRTEVGVIPEDWDVIKIGKHAKINTGEKDTKDRKDEGKYPFFVRSQDIERINTYSHDGEAVLTAGDGAGTGKVFHYINSKFDLHQRVYKIYDFSKALNGKYFYYQFSSRFLNRLLTLTAKSSVDSVRKETIAGMPIPMPDLKEQTAIATALSDVDNLIESLDKLIAKKKAIKQATMQQLLTGKKRLPGFSGEWETKWVADMGEVVTGGTPSTSNNTLWGARYPWITPTDISHNRDLYTSERHLSEKGLAAIKPLPPETVLITCIASIGKNAVLKKKGGCNQQINAIIPNSSYSANFIYYVMEHNKQYILANSGTTATNIISKVTFTKLKFSFPNFKEQKAIATILSDIDSEIEALEKRKAKTQQIKEGMMQELLTGKTRLVNRATETYE